MVQISCAEHPTHPEQTRARTMISPMLRPRAVAGRSLFSHARIKVILFLAATASIALGSAVPARGQNRFWITNAGGDFSSSANWSTTAGGAGGATPPGAAEVANFMLSRLYTVSFAANVTNTGLLVGNDSVTFDLNGNVYTITGATGTRIGTAAVQTSRLTIKDGTLGVDTAGDRISVGAAATASGFLTITTGGRLGNGISDADVFVGESGTGTLTVEDNGRADVGFLNLGQVAGATGTVTISGPNAVVDTSKFVSVGLHGTGTLNIQNSGTMSTVDYVRIGTVLGSSGTVTISGFESTWTQANWLTIGDAGSGSITVQAAAAMSTANAVSIGYQATGVGTAIVTGADSKWDMASAMEIGGSGHGYFAISGGGRATTAGTTSIGTSLGSVGNVFITGAGSRWSTRDITLGNAGVGNLTISDAGVANTNGNVTVTKKLSGYWHCRKW